MPRGRPRLDRDARREAILDVAQAVFLEEGFANASMSTIAARLGGSKGTLYNYFKSKDELFAAYIRRHCAWQQDADFSTELSGGAVREALIRVMRPYMAHVLTDFIVSHFRLISAEAERSPEVGRIFYETGPMTGAARLAGFLAELGAQGRLDIADPKTAAFQLIALCHDRLFKARLCGYAPEPTPSELEAEVATGVDTFLRAFGR